MLADRTAAASKAGLSNDVPVQLFCLRPSDRSKRFWDVATRQMLAKKREWWARQKGRGVL